MSNAELLQASRDAAKDTGAYRRIRLLLDEGTFHEIDAYVRSNGGPAEAVTGFGTVDGCPVYVFAQNSSVDGGAMSKAQAGKIRKLYELAVKNGAPVVGIYVSVGARLAEGADMMAAYGEVLRSSNLLSGVVPQIAWVAGPCIGTAALMAAGADLVVMTKDAELTADTAGEDASPEAAVKAGVCQLIAENDEEAAQAVRRLVSYLPSNNLEGAPVTDVLGLASQVSLTEESAGKTVLEGLADENSFLALGEGFGCGVTVGLAQVAGSTAGLLAYEGVIGADACAKAARFVRFCDCFSIPVVSVVNAEKFASLREASKLSSAYAEATAPKVAVITGEAYGPVYLALAGRGAGADVTLAWVDAAVSPLSASTSAIFEWSGKLAGASDPVAERKKLIEEYKKTEASPLAAAANGLLEDVIRPEETRASVAAYLEMLAGKRVTGLPKKHTNLPL